MQKETKQLLFSVTRDDCDWQYFCAGGPGGQHQNKTASACRVVHRASGAVGESREYKSQKQNRQAAFKRMAESKEFKRWHRIECARRLGQTLIEKKPGRSSDQLDRIRTYSFSDQRVTDHRTGVEIRDVEKVMDGNIDKFVEAMKELDSERNSDD